MATSPKIEEVEFVLEDAPPELPDPATLTLTTPLPERDVRDAISYVVAAADQKYAVDLITVLQVRARLAEDTGDLLLARSTLDRARLPTRPDGGRWPLQVGPF